MAKKAKRRMQRQNPNTFKLSSEQLAQKASVALQAGHYRNAIASFKELLKLEPRPDWQASLADAYAGRARELAAKQMLKEALVMWENRAALHADGAMHPDHAALLLRCGEAKRVLTALAGGTAAAAGELDRLRPQLAAQVIAGNQEIAPMLAEDDPVRRHAAAALDALDAYCSGNDDALVAALGAIPFRSPYRDWVQLLKALQQVPSRPDEARALLARIGDDSAFTPLRRAADIALLPDRDFTAAIAEAGETTSRFACALRGWPAERALLHQQLAQADAQKRPRTLLRILFRYRDKLGEPWVRRQAMRLLAVDFPDRLGWLVAEGGDELTEEEYLLVGAWSATTDDDPWELEEHWGELAAHLIDNGPSNGDDSLHRLRIATALRASELNGDLLQKMAPSDDPDDLDGVLAARLEQSLKYDPEHRDTYLRLIDYYRRGKRYKHVRRLLAQASAHWPNDMQILGAALDTALETGAFKKATGIARRMLDVDAINTAVRERLVDAHIAHGGKQLNNGRPDLARKELAAARAWARGGQAQERIDLTSGLIALVEDDSQGAAVLGAIVERIGGGLAGRIVLALAAASLDLGQAQLQRAAKLAKPASLGRDDLMAALGRLRAHLDRGGKKSKDLVAWLDKTFSGVSWKHLDRTELEAACETLRRYDLHVARRRAAEMALKRWPGRPVFELHAFEAKYSDGLSGFNNAPLLKLERAMDRARAEGDTRTALRIQNALDAANPFGGFPPIGFPSPSPVFPDLAFDDHAEDDIAFGGLPGGGPPGLDQLGELIRILGIEKVLDIMDLPPDLRREIKRIKKEMGEEAMTESLLAFLRMSSATDDGDRDPPTPKPPRSRGRVSAKRGKPKRAKSNKDDDNPDQLSLF